MSSVAFAPVEQLTNDWAKLWLPREKPSLSQWTETNFVLSPEYSAVTGVVTLFGWQREIFDSFTDPTVSKIVLKVGTQLVKTLFIQAAVAFVIAEAPGPILMVQPKDPDAETFSKERLSPMIRDNPLLADKFPAGKSPLNTITYKQFPGGSLTLVGSIVPGNMARRSIQYFFCDEVNKYPASAGKEGSPLRIGEERTATFGTRAKSIYTCSPTDDLGLISREYAGTDQREPWVACHKCGTFQVMRWRQQEGSGFVWWSKEVPVSERPHTARYICGHCQAQWNDVQRWRSAEAARWIAQKPFTGAAGFWISHLYSPHKTLAKMVKGFLDADATNDANELKVFINTNLAEDWRERGEAPEWKKLFDRAEEYPLGTVPSGALIITAGVDVHPDRIEVQVIGWGRNKESWLVDYLILYGDTARPEVWADLDSLVSTIYQDGDGREFEIKKLAIDSGFAKERVYDWARQQKYGSVVQVVKGGPATMNEVIGAATPVDVDLGGRKIKYGIKLQLVNVSSLKGQLYRWLQHELPNLQKGEAYAEGFVHICETPDTEEYCKQITAEELRKVVRRGFETVAWEKTRRNEALDTWIYARAAAIMLGIDRYKDAQWERLERSLGIVKDVASVEPVAEYVPPPPVVRKPSLLRPAVYSSDPYL